MVKHILDIKFVVIALYIESHLTTLYQILRLKLDLILLKFFEAEFDSRMYVLIL